MAAVLDEGLGGRNADLLAAHPGVAAHGIQIFIDAVVVKEPLPLADVASKHLGLLLQLITNVHVGCRLNDVAQRVLGIQRIAVVKIGDSRAFNDWKLGAIRSAVKEAGRPSQ